MSAETDDRSQSHDELVEVFGTKEESEAMVVRGLLESAGIEAIITAIDAPQDILPGVGGVIVRVSPERAEEARSLIEDYRDNAPTDEDEGGLNDDSAA
ncbi:MAG: DUF2007 domain-containing protein [Acidobacteriia bacterium]|jgi:hypothetical protein|nr:DUF2007 domain-containing protein [Terriglobia bacterium]